MHLPQTGSCYRRALEISKKLRGWCAQLLYDNALDAFRWIGRYLILQCADGGEIRFRQNVCACTEYLCQLDEGGAE